MADQKATIQENNDNVARANMPHATHGPNHQVGPQAKGPDSCKKGENCGESEGESSKEGETKGEAKGKSDGPGGPNGGPTGNGNGGPKF
jgi:hypothetical protein